ncbi:MAG: enoyl-CoA hydratase/isomerase family protein [Rhodoblastus sp.]|nr:enoyl-CoA hydratase/isomerase family protein [Rhodoblastus sp.]
MSRTYENVRLEIVNGVAWLEFARPPVNAFTRPMVEETLAAMKQALEDPRARVLVLASSVEAYFSAGADLRVFREMGATQMRDWIELVHQIARVLRDSSKPLLAAINGVAVGGGLEMALHCDLRFAADHAKFGQPEIAIAFIPPIATTQTLARLIGRPRAIRYLYEGKIASATEALEWGLVDELVPAAELRARVQTYAEELAAKPAQALAAIRRTITLGGGATFEEGMALELETASALADTDDFREGVRAFLEKRPPQWRR